MRTICHALAFFLFSTTAFSFAQSDPFGAAPNDDPFASGPTRKPAVRVKPKPQVVRPKFVGNSASLRIQAGTPEINLKIHAALGDNTSQTMVELPLSEAMAQLAETHDIPIVVDRRALEEIGISHDQPVTLSLKNVTLRSFVRLMLRELDLTYIVDDEVMQITTREVAERKTTLEMYRFPKQLVADTDAIIRSLTSAVSPDSWTERGGPCSVTAIENILVVSAPATVQDDVTNFLVKLSAAFEFAQ